MKKAILAAITLLLCLVCASALGNSWGLPGGLVALVEGDPMYADCSMGACDAATGKNRSGSVAVFRMDARNHSELFVARRVNGEWEADAVSSTAVRNAGWDEDGLAIELVDDGTFELRYPDALYRYKRDDHAWRLTYAELENGAATLTLLENGYGYAFARGGETVNWWTEALTISRFADGNDYRAVSIDLLPTTAEQVQRHNHTQSLLPDGMYFSVPLTSPGKGTLPVYSAPDDASMRFGNGKAAVGLAGELSVLDWRDGYMMVHYRVSQSAARIGYIREDESIAEALKLRGWVETDFDSGIGRWGRISAVIAEETLLTDDPHVSGGARNVLLAGTEITCIAKWGAHYALVEYAPAGQLVRGFVPMKDIAIPEPETDPEAMAQIENTAWQVWAGGTMYCDYHNYREDGLFIGEWIADEAGEPSDGFTAQYAISQYDPAWNLYWAQSQYMITFTRESGMIDRYGLDFGEDGINLKYSEGGGGYHPYTGSLELADQLAAQVRGESAAAQTTPEPPIAATPEPAQQAQSVHPQLGRVVQTDARDAETGMGEAVVSFASDVPGSLSAALAECGFSDQQVVQGFAQHRGRWEYAQMLLSDETGYTLCCGLYVPGAGWQLTLSQAAVQQGEAARLNVVGESCYRFDVVYPDVSYTWFCGSNGWQLQDVEKGIYRLSAGNDYVRWDALNEYGYSVSSSAVYSSQPILLTEFDIAAYPTTPEEALRQSEGHPENDLSKALIVMTQEQKTYRLSDMPCAPLYTYASGDAEVIAYLMDGVEPEALEVSLDGDFVRIRLGALEGWAERENVLLGAERAGVFTIGGETAQVYTAGGVAGHPLRAAPNEAAEQTGFLAHGESVHVLAIMPDDLWFYVRARNGQMGYMSYHTVCKTDNMHDAYIYSEDPTRRLNLRAFPQTDAQVLGKYYSGVRVVNLFSLHQADGWSRVIIEGSTGWVRPEYLTYWNDYNGREWLPPIGTVQGVNSKGLNIRTHPDGDVMTAYPVGTKMEILGVTQDGNWAHVRLRDGMTGYAMTRYLGGEPKRAAENSFKLKAAVTENAVYGGEVTGLTKGTRVRMAERPHAEWHTPGWREGDMARVFGEEAAVYVTDGEHGGFTTADNLALDW